jgi:hypothetical protein
MGVCVGLPVLWLFHCIDRRQKTRKTYYFLMKNLCAQYTRQFGPVIGNSDDRNLHEFVLRVLKSFIKDWQFDHYRYQHLGCLCNIGLLQ